MNPWAILAVLFFARTTMGLQFQSTAAVSPLLMASLGIDLAALGALIGAWMLPGIAVAIPGGLLGRRFGDKRTVLAALALMVAGSFVGAVAETYAAAMAARVVSGAGAVVLNVLLVKMVGDWFQDRRLSTAMSLLVVSWPIGIGLALALLGPLAAGTSWAAALQVPAWLCLAALVLVAAVYRAPGEARAGETRLRWRMQRRDLALAVVAGLVWTFYNAAYIIAVGFAPALLAQRGFEVGNAALLASFATWGLVLTVPLGGLLADRTGRGHAIMLAGTLAMALAMPFLLAAPSPGAALALFGLLAGPAGGIIASLPARHLSPEARHLGLGIFFTLYYVGMALLPALAGASRAVLAFDAAPLVFGAFLLVLCALLLLYFRRLEKINW